jgi:hypothetical protein
MPEDGILHSNRREYFTSYLLVGGWFIYGLRGAISQIMATFNIFKRFLGVLNNDMSAAVTI